MTPAAYTLGRLLGVLSCFAALTVAHTWPMADVPAHRLPSGADVLPGLWSLTETARQLIRDPVNLMDGNIFYPFGSTLAILDHQLTSAALALPLVAAGATGAQVYNTIVMVTFLLSGFFMYLLGRRLTGSETAGLVAGVVFAFGTYRATHVSQAHLLATQWLPLALLAVHRYLELPTWKRWTSLALATVLVALSSWHIAVIGAVGIGVVAGSTLLADPTQWRRKLVGLMMVASVSAVVLAPLAMTYAAVGARWPPATGAGRETLETISSLSSNVVAFASAPHTTRAPYASLLVGGEFGQPGLFPGVVVCGLVALVLFGWWGQRPVHSSRFARPLTLVCWGAAALLGLIVAAAIVGPAAGPVVELLRPIAPVVLFGVALAAVGVAVAPGHGRAGPASSAVLTYVLLATTGALLALGPRVAVGDVDVGSGLWRLDLLPVRLLIRAPERLSLLLCLGLAVLAGFGAARLARLVPRGARLAVAIGMLAVLNVDLAFAIPPLIEVPPPSAAERWLARSTEAGAVIDYPLHWTNRWAIYGSQRYGRRIVNGTGYLFPMEYRAIEELPDLSPRQLALVWEHFHPRFVLVRFDLYEPDLRAQVRATIAAQPAALRPVAELGSEIVYELVDRGRGAELFRRWPADALRDAREVDVEAWVTPGRADTVGALVVDLDGETVIEASGAAVETPARYTASFAGDSLEPGLRAFTIVADYRFAAGAARHRVGSTGVEVAADIVAHAGRERATVQVNGRLLRVDDKGYFLVVLEAGSGEVHQVAEFNVSWSGAESAAMAGFIRAIPAGAVVVAVTEFDASRALTADAVAALAELGMTADLRGRYQTMHAAIGVKGAAAGSALEAIESFNAQVGVGRPDTRQVQIESFTVR